MVPVMKLGWIAVALSVALAGCASEAVDTTVPSTGTTTSGPTGTTDSGRSAIEVPGVLGISSSEAAVILEAADVPYVAAPRLSDEPPGTVLSQTPREGQRLFPGDYVTLRVATKRPRCYEYAESC